MLSNFDEGSMRVSAELLSLLLTYYAMARIFNVPHKYHIRETDTDRWTDYWYF